MAKKNTGFDPSQVITINKDQEFQQDNKAEDMAQNLKNSEVTKKILSGELASVEPLRISDTKTIVVGVVNYYGNRVIIPLDEMNIQVKSNDTDPEAIETKKQKVLNNMIGCQVDFIVEGCDLKNGSTVASRKKAMQKKAKTFYIDNSESTKKPIITPGQIVEARVVAVTETFVRIEVFGAECFVLSRHMAQLWMANARDYFFVGDVLPVKILTVDVNNGEVEVTAEAKSLYPKPGGICTKGGKYVGVVTGISKKKKGVGLSYFLRLNVEVNAVAFSCDFEYPMPKKGDKVSFVCTRFDKDEPLAAGIITRVIRQAY